jgi:hypothetical protein
VALVQYAAPRGVSLPIKYRARYAQSAPAAWQGVTRGLVEGFVKWLLLQGYSVASANNRLAAVKVYTRRMAKAGVIPPKNTLSSAKCVATTSPEASAWMTCGRRIGWALRSHCAHGRAS